MLAACAVLARQEGAARAARLPVPLGERFGALTLTGAVAWHARRPDFGGFSGLELDADGPGFTALTDKAHWARAALVLDAHGALTGIDGLEMNRLRGPDGTNLMRPATDSEALTRAPDGAWLIGFEGRHRIGRFATLRAAEETLPPLPGIEAMPPNGSLESVAALPDGRIVALAEAAGEGGYPGWIVEGDDVVRFTVARHGWFAPTDLASGPEGEWLYLLERRFTLIGGFGARLRRFPVAALAEGARIEAGLLAEIARPPLAENYEGLAVTRDAAGRGIVYMISDDNFRTLQRTLLVQFRMDE